MNYQIEKKETFKMFGVSTEISTVDRQNYDHIPKLWRESTVNGTIDRLQKASRQDANKDRLNAVLYNFGEDTYSYLIGYHMPENGVPEDYDTIAVPALTWTVFSTGGCTEANGIKAIQSLWDHIFAEWFPTSGYEHADGPELEMYFRLSNNNYNHEIGIPVVKK